MVRKYQLVEAKILLHTVASQKLIYFTVFILQTASTACIYINI